MSSAKKPIIIFDVDGTLVIESERLLAQTQAVAYHFGKTHADMQAVLFAFFECNDYAVKEKPELKNNIPEYMKMMGEKLGKRVTDDEANTLALVWSQAYTDAHDEPVLFSDAGYCLDELSKRGFELIVASGNTVASRIALLEKIGIAHYFSQVYAATDVGYQKQDIQFWEMTLGQLDWKKGDRVVVVGNQLNDDIKNPIALGVPAVLIDRPGELKKIKEEVAVIPTAVFDDLKSALNHPMFI